jgi:hypothetical protein
MGRELPSAAVVIYAVHNWVKYYCALQHKRNDLAENLGKLARKFSVFLGGLIAAHCSALHWQLNCTAQHYQLGNDTA